LQAGDLIVGVEALSSPSVIQVIELVHASANKPLAFTVLRGNSKLQLQVTPSKSGSDKNARIGVGFAQLERVEVRYGLVEGVGVALRKTWDITALTLKMLGQIALGQASLSNLSGPLTIADAAGKTASVGLGAYITFLALVSVGLGVLNLLPVPMLDGGHLLYYAAEGVTGRPLSDGVMAWGQRIGIGLLGALMVIALTNDFVRLLG
jgi:regulator of sigma E protease